MQLNVHNVFQNIIKKILKIFQNINAKNIKCA